MASIKVSELPQVLAITPNDVLIINDENATTSKITIANFTTSYSAQPLSFTGTVSFAAATSFLAGSTPVFSSDATFNERATFNGPITLGSLALIPIGSLSDVTVPATITNGHVLTWDNANAYWTSAPAAFAELIQDATPSLGGNLDVNGYSIVSGATQTGPNGTNIILTPTGSGQVVVSGNVTSGSGQITLNCENNSHGVKVKGPAHAAAANYTFILPVAMGANGQVLTTNGTDQTSWVSITPALIGAATAAQGSTADSAMQVAGPNVIPAFADDAAAAGGGVAVGGLYRIGNAVQVRLA